SFAGFEDLAADVAFEASLGIAKALARRGPPRPAASAPADSAPSWCCPGARSAAAWFRAGGEREGFEIGHYGRALRYVLLRDALRNLSLAPSAGCRAVNHLGLTGSDPLQG